MNLSRHCVMLLGLATTGWGQIDRAVSLAQKHRYSEAAAALQGVAPPETKRQLIAYHRLKAAIASGMGDAGASAKEMETALDLAPEDPNLLQATAIAEAQANLLDPAIAHLKHAQAIHDSAALQNLLGDVQERSGDSLAAIQSYQAAVQQAAEVEEYRFALALELLRHQTFEPAILVLEKALQDFPRSSRLRIALAVTYFLVDRDADASRVLLQAMRLDPEPTGAADYLGEMQLTQTASPDPAAVQELCHFADMHPRSGRAQAICGGLLLRTERPALERLRKAAEAAPQEPLARCNLGKALEAEQNWAAARVETEACARLQPDSPEAHYRLARIYRKLGLADAARREDEQRAQADRKQTAENERRYSTLTRFLYTLSKAPTP